MKVTGINSDGSINTQLTGSMPAQGKDVKVVQRSGNLALSTTEILLNVTTPIIIDNLVVGTPETTNIGLKVELYDKVLALKPIYIPSGTGSTISNYTTVGSFLAANDEAGLMKCFLYNNTLPAYRFGVKYSLVCPFGVKVSLLNVSASLAYNVAATVSYREV